MRVLGFWLKAASALLAVLASFAFGIGIENGTLADYFMDAGYVLAVAAGLHAAGNHFRPRNPAGYIDVAGRSGTRQLRPGRKQQQWLAHEVWLEFPDPLPGVPDVTGRPETDIPRGEVPPDENLRRLWLVRAQLAVHLDRARARRKKVPGLGGVVVSAAGLTFCALWILAGPEPPGEEQTMLGRLFGTAVTLALFGVHLIGYTERASLPAKRREALRAEETRLMALDATRPGGPIGGPAVQAGEIPYVPPSLAEFRQG